MKVAIFYPWLEKRGGAERLLLEYVTRTKHRTHIFTWFFSNTTFNEFGKHRITLIGPRFLKSLYKILRPFPLLPQFILFILALCTRIDFSDFDAFLVLGGGYSEFILFSNYIKGRTFAIIFTPYRPTCKKLFRWYLSNVNFLYRPFYLFYIYLYTFLEKLWWGRIDYPIFISKLGFKRAKEKKLLKHKTFFIVYPGADFHFFSNKKLSKLINGKYLLYVSRFAPLKRQDLILKAWRSIESKHKDYFLVLAGSSSSFLERLKKIKETLKLERAFFIIDPSNQTLSSLYKHTRAGLFLSIEEDFGIVPLEVLYFNKPLITVDKGGFTEVIPKTPSIIWLRETYTDWRSFLANLEKALEDFISNEQYYIKNAKKNRQKILSLNLTWKKFAYDVDNIISSKIKQDTKYKNGICT